MDVELREIRDFLARHAPFDVLPPAVLAGLPRECTLRYHRRGTVILAAGEQGDGLYVVRSGAVDITDGAGGLIGRLGAGRAFGMTSLLEDRPSRFECTAIEDTLVIVLATPAFRRLAAEHPPVATFFAATHHDRMARALSRLQRATSGAVVLGTAVAEIATREVVSVDVAATVREAARTMAEARVSSIVVLDGDRLAGILTDRDLRTRVLAADLDPARPVAEVMTPDPATLPRDSLAFEALLEMAAHNVHHLPLVDADGRVAAVVSTSDLIRLERANPVYLAAGIARQETLEGVVEQARLLPGVLGELVDRDATAADLGRIMTALGDAVRRRVLTLATAELEAAGLGPAPVPWAWLVLGSAAREEEGLAADQDHALVVAEEGHDAWFAALADRVVEVLEECGWPRCPGEVMATNPRWRRTPQQWSRSFIDWATEPVSEAVLHVATFHDLRHLHGDPGLSARVTASRRSSPALVGHLTGQALRMRPPLGFFRHFVLESEGEHRDTLDIKRGISAVVQVARVHALRTGSGALSTRDRLAAAAEAGAIAATDATDLTDALELMNYLRLRHQVAQLRSGQRPDNHLAPGRLSERERRNLRDAFTIVRSAQQRLGELVGPAYL